MWPYFWRAMYYRLGAAPYAYESPQRLSDLLGTFAAPWLFSLHRDMGSRLFNLALVNDTRTSILDDVRVGKWDGDSDIDRNIER